MIASVLAGSGYGLILTARHAGRLQGTAVRLRQLAPEVELVVGDVAEAAHRRALARAVRAHGALDVLVNNASELGPSPLPPLAEHPLASWRRVLEVNLLSPVALVQQLRPALTRAGGLVVNISSDAAVGAYPGWGGYGSSKAALDLASRTLAEELRGERIGVVSVDPGDLRTALHQRAYPGQSIEDRPLPEVTRPFWAWLFGQEPMAISGQRFRAQSERWEVGR